MTTRGDMEDHVARLRLERPTLSVGVECYHLVGSETGAESENVTFTCKEPVAFAFDREVDDLTPSQVDLKHFAAVRVDTKSSHSLLPQGSSVPTLRSFARQPQRRT